MQPNPKGSVPVDSNYFLTIYKLKDISRSLYYFKNYNIVNFINAIQNFLSTI